MGHSKWSDIKRAKGVPDGYRSFMATAEPDGDFWLLRVPQLPGCIGQALTRDDIEASARDVIAVWLNAPLDSFGVLVIELDGNGEPVG